jgi:hypothetical protein
MLLEKLLVFITSDLFLLYWLFSYCFMAGMEPDEADETRNPIVKHLVRVAGPIALPTALGMLAGKLFKKLL